MENRKIIHVDMDAFFAAIEQRDHPEWRGKPLVVSGPPDSRSVVSTASYEARKYGIHSAMPSSQAFRLCPHAIFAYPRFSVYKEVSSQIQAIFRDYTDLVEPLSLDEAYLDVTENKKNNPSATWIAQEIRQRIYESTRLTASAGVSYCKFIAKIASDYHKPNGLTVILPEQAQEFLDALPVSKFFGIGKVTAGRMMELGIHYGRDLRRHSREELSSHFGKMGNYFYDIVRGIDDRPINLNRERKSLSVERTFEDDKDDWDEIEEIIEGLAHEVEQQMEKKGFLGRTMVLKIRYADFQRISRSQTLDIPTRDSSELAFMARSLLKMTEFGKRKIRLLGVGFQNLLHEKDIFEETDEQLWLPFPRD